MELAKKYRESEGVIHAIHAHHNDVEPKTIVACLVQAGREVRIMVKPEVVSEDQMVLLARDIAKKIEDELEYPGQIKVHLLRETKAIEYAK